MNKFYPEIKKNFGFGMMRLPMCGENVDTAQTCAMVDAFLTAGFNYFDTAHGYIGGKSELAVKECLTSRYPRESYILTDKLSPNFFKTEADIREKLEKVKECVATVAEISRTDIVGYRDKLEARLRAILGENGIVADEARLLTECAVFADKIAIDEELARLDSHMCAFDEICRAKEPSGRKLDFLMQEMNRETNTIGSKANNARIARLVVNVKGELEKIREQVQNIE